MRRRWKIALAGAVTVVAVSVLTAALRGTRAPPTVAPAAATPAELPAPVPPAFTVPTPRPLRGGSTAIEWAPVERPIAARTKPSRRAAVIARIGRSTPERTANILLVLARAHDESGGVWLKVRLPVLPNGTTGWVPRGALGGYVEVRTHLVVDLRRLTATLLRDGRPVFSAPIGVGTPAGGFVGIHGTNRPELIPGRISHGCIRLRNRDIVRLDKLMPVGTPLTIR